MASIFTYDPDPPRVSSPWSASGSSTPQVNTSNGRGPAIRPQSSSALDDVDPDSLSSYGIAKLEPEPQEGPTEYKLHLLLRPRRPYVSMSTGRVGGSYHSRVSAVPISPPVSSTQAQDAPPKPMQAKSTQSRQQRLQGLTTQLLWRLQQSSPFHSSTAANLVVPILPDGDPQGGVPPKPTRLLPGLEESQGALYEIGIADDGTFVGLTRDELDESVINLQAMAASLGCRVEILRRVVVGKCEWIDEAQFATADSSKSNVESLWVAEALVSPDLDFYNLSPNQSRRSSDVIRQDETQPTCASEEPHSHTQQIRVSIAGPSTAGKSSLLGTLTSSSLDNGRGTSRLSLLKHRHEISSGITSSVTQELIGYTNDIPPAVINYASGNVTAWDDIHAASRGGRLAFVSDMPGSVRYLKSIVRGLISWAPHYVLLCIPANCGEESAEGEAGNDYTTDIDLCLAYLQLCLKLEIPTLVVITKLDVASKGGLRENLTKVLSALKTAGRKPLMFPAPSTGEKPLDLQHISPIDSKEVQKTVESNNGNWHQTVPIVLASAVDGTGISKIHALLRYLPIPSRPAQRRLRLPPHLVPPPQQNSAIIFDVDEVFAIPPSKVYSISAEKSTQEGRGMVLCGLVRHGSVSVGDELTIGPILVDTPTGNSNDHTPLPPPFRSSGPGSASEFPASFVQRVLSGKDASSAQVKWQRVRVVSVRNLRLPVRRLMKDQVGTIGVDLNVSTDDGRLPRLSRIRKGMVLTNFLTSLAPTNPLPTPLPPTLSLPFHTGFTATFPATEFSAPSSPPLLLGGNAIAYIANIRTTVRVVCMALAGTGDDSTSSPPSPSEPEFFNFDSDGHAYGSCTSGTISRQPSTADISKVVSGASGVVTGAPAIESLKEDVKITFALVTSVEWVELGLQVLIMPGVSMTPSPSGVAVTSGHRTGAMSGLEGFVGTICEVVSRNSTGNES